MRFDVLVNRIFPNSHFSATRNVHFLIHWRGPKVNMCYSDFLLAEKQLERFGQNPFSHFLLAEEQIERF